LSGEQAAYLAAHTIPNLGAAPQAPKRRPLNLPARDAAHDQRRSYRQGSTTFADLLGWGLSKDDRSCARRADACRAGTTVKDCVPKRLEL